MDVLLACGADFRSTIVFFAAFDYIYHSRFTNVVSSDIKKDQ